MNHWTPAKKVIAAGSFIGLGLLVFYSRRKYAEHNGLPIVLDADLDSDTRRAVMAALRYESDVSILHTFAAKLDAANFHKSSDAVRVKLHALLQGRT
jgi:hypothetical protein